MDPESAGIAAAGGIISGLLGNNTPQLPPELQQLYKYLMKLSRERYAFSKGIPGSDPQEIAALAQAHGLAGQNYAAGKQQLLAGIGTNNPDNSADALGRFGAAQAANLSGIDANMLQQFLQARRNAVGEAAGIASGAGGAAHGYYQPNENIGAMFGQLAQQVGLNRGMQQYNVPVRTPGVFDANNLPFQGFGAGGAPPFDANGSYGSSFSQWDPNKAPAGF